MSSKSTSKAEGSKGGILSDLISRNTFYNMVNTKSVSSTPDSSKELEMTNFSTNNSTSVEIDLEDNSSK